MTIYGFFRQRYIDISRSYDLVYFRDAFCSKCKGCNRLCTACFVYFICACLFCSDKNCRIDFSFCITWGGHDDLIDTCHFCRHDVHQNRRRIYRFSARYINTDFLQRCHFLSQHRSLRRALEPAVLFLQFMVALDIDQCFADHIQKCRIYSFVCLFKFCFCYFYIGSIDVCLVKLFRIGKQGFVSVFLDVLNDRLYPAFVLSVPARASL